MSIKLSPVLVASIRRIVGGTRTNPDGRGASPRLIKEFAIYLLKIRVAEIERARCRNESN